MICVKNLPVFLFVLLVACTGNAFSKSFNVASPNGDLVAFVNVNQQGIPQYHIQYNGIDVLKPSSLGIICNDISLNDNLELAVVSPAEKVSDSYQMIVGKKKVCLYNANRRVATFQNSSNQKLQIEFQVSDHGVAFRYSIPGNINKSVTVNDEITSFAFPPDTISWLHPMAVAKTGWSKTQPSYEEYYSVGQNVGNPSPFNQGWCFPALFKTSDNIWALICETNVSGTYTGTRLAHDSTGGIYKISFPQAQEHRGPVDPVTPAVKLPFTSPWRVIIIGNNLNSIVQSTLITDLAEPCKVSNTDFVVPGKAAWHWLRYSDESATLEYADSFLDFAVKMKWQYMLIDASWDQYIGYEKMTEFVKKAKSKNIDVILWYNSNGPWNDAPMTPKNKMHERDIRRKEFAILKDMGVRGVKIDFFGGDKQATMQLYYDICADAADYQIMVNFHGTTIPRGWQRTYPNLMTMEAVRGMEYCTFEQRNADQQPQHCTILPFTRNVIGSMDFTPIVFNPKIRASNLKTTLAFELALSVVFESGIQHLGLVPDECKLMPDYIVSYLQDVPTAWDETRLIDGYPGEFAVFARRKADKWYIAGINGTESAKKLSLDLSFISAQAHAVIITDGPDRTFNKTVINGKEIQNLNIEIKPNGGFVLVTE